MAGDFVKTLAIVAKINTSQVASEAKKIGAQMDAGIKEAARAASASMGAFDQAIDNAKEKAKELEEPMSAGVKAMHELGQRTTEEIKAQIEKIKAAYESVRNDSALSDRDRDVAFARTREQVERLEMELKRGVPQAASQGFAGAQAAMGGFKNTLRSIWSQVSGPLAGVFAIGGSISSYLSGASNAGEMAKELKVDVEELQIWSGAVERAGGSAESLKETIQKLTASGKANGDAFGTLLALSDKANKMSKEAFERKAKELDIDEKTIEVLYKGRKELEVHLKRQEELGVYTKEDAKISKDFKQALSDLGTAWNSFTSFIGRIAVPIMKVLADVFTEIVVFFRQHTPFVAAAIGIIGAALSIKLLPPLKDIPKYLGNIWKGFIKWAPLIAIVALLAILIDDFVGYLTGAETEFGEFWAIFGTGPEILAALQSAWSGIKEVLVVVGEALKNLIKYFLNLGQSTGYFKALGQTFRGLLQIIKGIFTLDFSTLHDGIVNFFGGLANSLIASFKALFIIVTDTLSKIWDALKNAIPGLSQWGTGITNIFKGIFSFDFSQILSGIKDTFSGALDIVSSALRGMLNISGNIWSAIIETFTGKKLDIAGMFTGAYDSVVSILTSIKDWIVDWFSKLFDIDLPDFSAIAKSIWDSITGIFNDLKTWVVDWFKNLFSGIKLPAIGDILGGAGELAKGALGAVGSLAQGAGAAIGKGLDFGKSMLSGAGDWFSGLFKGVDQQAAADKFAAALEGSLDEAFDELDDSAQNGISKSVKEACTSAGTYIQELFAEAQPASEEAGANIRAVMEETANAIQESFNLAWSASADYGVQAFQNAAITIQQIFATVISGIDAQIGALVAGAQQMSMGAGMIPAFAGVRAQNSSVSNVNNTSSVNIGTMNVATRATDANGVARGMSGALNKNRLVQAGQSGVNQK